MEKTNAKQPPTMGTTVERIAERLEGIEGALDKIADVLDIALEELREEKRFEEESPEEEIVIVPKKEAKHTSVEHTSAEHTSVKDFLLSSADIFGENLIPWSAVVKYAEA